jgi:hypothetical protein
VAATLIQSASNQGTTTALAVGAGQGWAAPTAGNLIVAWADSDATVTVNNTMTAGPSVVDGNGAYCWYKIATGAETSYTFTPSANDTIIGGVLEYSGVTATPFDVQNSSTTTGVDALSCTAVSVTATNAVGDLFVAFALLHENNGQVSAPVTPAWTNGFTTRQGILSVGTINSTPYCAAFVGDFQNTGAATVSTQASWSTGQLGDRQELLIAFKLAAAGGGSPAIAFAPKRRRVGLPPRKILRQGRISTPVRAQLNPPIIPTDVRERRRFLVPVRRSEIASPLTAQAAAPVNPAVSQLVSGRTLRRWLTRNRAQQAADGPLTAQDVLPVTTTRRRLAVPSRRPRVAAPAPVSARHVPPAVVRSSRLPRVLRRGQVVAPVQTQVTVINPTITATVFGRLRLTARVKPRAKVSGPIPTQQAAATNPTITATAFGRLRLVGRYQPRPRVNDPVPAQQAAATNPTITKTVFGRLRTVGRYQPRAKVNDPVPAQQAAVTNPTITATVFGRLRSVGRRQPRARITGPIPGHGIVHVPAFGRLRAIGRIQPKARITTPAPVQTVVTNPQITATVFGRLRSIGRIQPRARVNDPVPAQQQIAPNPKITATMFGRLRLSGRTNRIPRIVKPTPAQINPPYPVKPSRVIAVRGISRRRGAPVSAPQVQPTAETRTIPSTGLRGLRRVWLKIRRKNVTPVPGQVTTLEGPLIITDSSGGVSGLRGGTAGIGGVYGSDDGVTGKYDSDSDTL